MLRGAEWQHRSHRSHQGVVGKICPGNEYHPGVLLIVAGGSKGLFHCLGLPLSLVVSLQVEGSQESVVDTHLIANSSPESAGELHSMICDNVVLFATHADHMLEKPML